MDTEKQFSDKTIEDFHLIDLINSTNDQKAYAQLLKRYKKSVYHIILKMVRNLDDAEDLTMEVFSKAFKSLNRFKKDFAFSTWLFRIASNHTIDFLRKKRLQTMSLSTGYTDEAGESLGVDLMDFNLNPQEEAIREEKIKIMRKLVGGLPDRYKKLVQLRYFDELSYEEIAKEINAPLGTVKAQLHRSREIMLEMIAQSKEAI